jgi:regulator of PEP synthase PpsR (kinase-PPPase family)
MKIQKTRFNLFRLSYMQNADKQTIIAMVLTAQRLWSISNTSFDEESRHPTYASAQAVNLEARDLSHMAAKCRSSAQRYLHAIRLCLCIRW